MHNLLKSLLLGIPYINDAANCRCKPLTACNCWQPTVSCLLYMSSVCVKDFSTRAKLQCNWWRSQELKSNAFLKEGLMCWKSTLLFFLFILIFCLFLPFLQFCFFNIKTGKPKKLNTLVGHAEHLKAHGTPFCIS